MCVCACTILSLGKNKAPGISLLPFPIFTSNTIWPIQVIKWFDKSSNFDKTKAVIVLKCPPIPSHPHQLLNTKMKHCCPSNCKIYSGGDSGMVAVFPAPPPPPFPVPPGISVLQIPPLRDPLGWNKNPCHRDGLAECQWHTDGTAVEEEHAGKPTRRLDGTFLAPRLWNTCQQLYGTRVKENAGPASFPAKTLSPPPKHNHFLTVARNTTDAYSI